MRNISSFVQIKPTISLGSKVYKYGKNDDIDSAGNEDIVSWGGLAFFPTSVVSAGSIEISSTSANDTSVGTGLRTVDIFGLDANWKEQSETVTLNGTTVVNPVNDYLRIYRVKGRTVGSGGVNAGAINVTDGSNTLGQIPAGAGQSKQAVFTIADDYKMGHILWYSVTMFGTNVARCEGALVVRDEGETWRELDDWTVANTENYQTSWQPFTGQLNPRTDIRLYCADSNANNVAIAGKFFIYLER